MRVRRRSLPGAALLFAAALTRNEQASGAEHWLTLTTEASHHCTPERGELSSRIAEALAGDRDAELAVHVVLADAPRGTTALLRLGRGDVEIGTKRIEASDCEEALDAVVTILALAIALPQAPSSPASESRGGVWPSAGTAPARRASQPVAHGAPNTSTPVSESEAGDGQRSASPGPSAGPSSADPSSAQSSTADPSAAESSAAEPSSADASPADRSFSARSRSASFAGERWRWLWSAGVAWGALEAATPVIATGVGLELGRAELRGSLQYGLPSSDERLEEDVGFQRSRADFAALSADYCHALDGDRWLSACAALEARLTRRSRVEALEGQPRIERDGLDAAALAGGGVSLAYAAATWRPRFDLSARRPIVGTSSTGENIQIVASLGGSLPF